MGEPRGGPSWRQFFGAATAAALAAGGGGYAVRAATESDDLTPASTAKPGGSAGTDRSALTVPFYGPRQAGITTAQQERLMFASLDVTSTDPRDLELLLGRWAALAARFTAGETVSASPDNPAQPPFD
jgi:deferrochelatase/peroxidase EfeB